LAFIATGSMVRTALDLAHAGFDAATVWSVPRIKPAPVQQIAAVCADSRALITLEEHSVIGGLGSTVAEIAAESMPRRILRIGVNDCFSSHCGTYEYLLREHGLDVQSVAERVRDFESHL
jgi:transketolase